MLKISTKKIDSDNINEGVWVNYSDGVRFKVRQLTGDAIRMIRQPFVSMEMGLNKSSRRLEKVEKVDQEALDDALATYLIEAWEGIGDEDGNVLPDNLDSRQAILNQLPLREFIWETAQSLEVYSRKKREADLKN